MGTPFRQSKRWKNRSEEHTSELQSQSNLVCRLLLEKKTVETHIYPARSIATGTTPETIKALARDMEVLASLAANGTFNQPLGTAGIISTWVELQSI